MNEIKIDKIIRSKRKTIALVVSDDATFVVRAPMLATLEHIKNLVFKKRFWINKKKKQVLKNGGPAKNKEFVNGEGFLYLGETYKLKIENCETVKLSDYLYFPQKCLNNAPVKMMGWYKQKALEKITERANWYSQIIGWKFKSISITNAERRWGSCGPSGSINFSWKLIMAPLNVIDYVVAHELTHIAEKNHSARFWNKVKTVLPDYKSRQRWLKDNGVNLKI
ncbi:M48 family metallopeptidase [Patescibacteria group bacterium]|nr:M48 family metallopeptidase [Patescibacteria group bacterium]MBU4579500.1 M48 family metallopeptidase [Patescibacteria group bacterium]